MCWYYLSPLWKTLWGFWVLVNGLKGWEVKEGRFLYHLMSTLEQGKTNVRTKVALIVVVDVYHTSLVGFPNANKSRAFAIHSCPPAVHFLFQTLNGIQFVGLDCHLNIYMFFHIFNLAHLLAWCSWHWLLYEIQTRFKELSTTRGFVLLYEFSMDYGYEYLQYTPFLAYHLAIISCWAQILDIDHTFILQCSYLSSILSRQNSGHIISDLTENLDTIDSWVLIYHILSLSQ